MNTKSWDEIVKMVGDAAAKARPGQWIVGRGWHQEKWTSVPSPNVEGFPTHESLDKVSPNNPVILTHASGHASFANGKAMEVMNLTAKTPNPAGGEILKDKAGNPTGLLRETASGLIRPGTGQPAPTAAEANAEAETRDRTGEQGDSLQGRHQLPGRRFVVHRRRALQADGGRRAVAGAAVGDDSRRRTVPNSSRAGG